MCFSCSLLSNFFSIENVIKQSVDDEMKKEKKIFEWNHLGPTMVMYQIEKSTECWWSYLKGEKKKKTAIEREGNV